MIIDEDNNIEMTRGDSESITVWVEGRPFVDGDVIEMTVRDARSAKIVLHKRVTEFDENGMALIEILPEDTKDASFRTYIYDIQWSDVNGAVTTIIKPAHFEMGKEVTY